MTNPIDNQALIEETLKLMELSSMSEDERTMWTIMLPSLEKAEIEKLQSALEKEVTQMTNIYLRAKQDSKTSLPNQKS